MSYRADLDGLRGIAVLLVLGYHALLPGFSRGFLGVDIFFVLSGYLISQGIFTQLAAGSFDLKSFYARRLRRILPALVAMLIATTLAACLLLYPPELEAFAQSALAASLQASNLYFLVTTDYFAEGNSFKPLLHTWSLGVEQQFYLLFPLLCLTLYAKGVRHFGVWMTVVGSLSFLLWVWHGQTAPAASFFSPLSRGWQLLLGALLASGSLAPPPERGASSIAAGIGLGMIALALTLPTSTSPPLGPLWVTFGTGLVIWSGQGQKTALQHLLGWRPLVFTGLISYSLYLWHWPILRLADRPLIDALAAFGTLEGLSAGVLRLVLLAVSFGVAVLSWRFIEMPFRHRLPRRYAHGVPLGGCALAAVAALALLHVQGLPQRFPPEVSRLASYLNTPHPEYREHECFLTSRSQGQTFQSHSCLGTSPSWALLGDSHAAHLAHGMRHHFGEISQITASGCKPLLMPAAARTTCQKLIEKAYAEWLYPAHVQGVVIAARWQPSDSEALIRSVHALRARGLEVHVIGPQPQYYYEVPLILASGQEAGTLELPRLRALDRHLWASLPQGSYHSVFEQLCSEGPCPLLTPSGIPIAFDYSHLTAEGSVMVVSGLAKAIGFPPAGRR